MNQESKQNRRPGYLDLELEIGPGEEGEYPVAILHSPAGEAREKMLFPFDAHTLESRLKDMQTALLESGGKQHRALSPEGRSVQDFGRALFDALFIAEVRACYDVSLREATRQDKGLRLKLRFQAPELAALPWEFLYDSRQEEYVCLSRNTPIVRYLEMVRPIRPLTVTPPLRILGMIASPQDQKQLDATREKQRMEAAIEKLQMEGLVELTWLAGQTWRDLQRATWGGPWHIFHFIGHGAFDHNSDEGAILLADDEGRSHFLSATKLGRLLADHRSLRLALLNSCEGARGSELDIFSSTASVLVRRGIPAVLAMQYEITNQAATELASAFYEALVHGMPIDESVAAARQAISLAASNTVEWGVPVLYMRSPDGILFNLTEKPIKAERAIRETPASGRQEGDEYIAILIEARTQMSRLLTFAKREMLPYPHPVDKRNEEAKYFFNEKAERLIAKLGELSLQVSSDVVGQGETLHKMFNTLWEMGEEGTAREVREAYLAEIQEAVDWFTRISGQELDDAPPATLKTYHAQLGRQIGGQLKSLLAFIEREILPYPHQEKEQNLNAEWYLKEKTEGISAILGAMMLFGATESLKQGTEALHQIDDLWTMTVQGEPIEKRVQQQERIERTVNRFEILLRREVLAQNQVM